MSVDTWTGLYLRAVSNSGLSDIDAPLKVKDRKEDFEAYNFLRSLANNPKELLEDYQNIVIYSNNVGNGKTHWSKVLTQAFIAEYCTHIKYSKQPAIFLKYANLIFELSSFTALGTDLNKNQSLKKWARVPLLIIDDLGTGEINKNGYPLLYSLIDERMERRLPTIYTTNLTKREVGDILGERLASRIYDNSTLVAFNAQGMRGEI